MTIKINRPQGNCDARDILRRSGYQRLEKSGSYWTKDNKEFEFIGWESDGNGLMKHDAKYIEIKQV